MKNYILFIGIIIVLVLVGGAFLSFARDEAKNNSLTIGEDDIFSVPGCYEIPLQAHRLLKNKRYQALIVLGYIEKGETLHGAVMGHVVHQSLINLQLEFNTPIGLGIIGPGATIEQAQTRQDSTARAAARAVIKSILPLQLLPSP